MLGSRSLVDLVVDRASTSDFGFFTVDPVMVATSGHRLLEVDAVDAVRTRLLPAADLITPNLTEACMLLGESYQSAPLTRAEAKSKLVRLSKLGPDRVIITGVGLASGEAMTNIGYDRARGTFWYIACDYVPASYPGTGDLFAAVLTGALLQNDSLPMAMARATHFAQAAIKTTYGYGTDPRFGVMLEPLLGQLAGHEVYSDYQTL